MTFLKKIEENFYFYLTLVSIFFIVVGFTNFYSQRILYSNEVTPLSIHIHALIFSLWLVIIFIQTYAIQKSKLKLHKTLGKIGIPLAFIMLLSGIYTAIEMCKAGHMGIPGLMFPTPEGFLLLNFNAAISFFVLAVLGIINKDKTEFHKRYLLMATIIGLAPPGISRMPFISGHKEIMTILVILFILIAPIFEYWRLRQIHFAYKVSLVLMLFISPPLIIYMSQSEIWISFSKFLYKLV